MSLHLRVGHTALFPIQGIVRRQCPVSPRIRHKSGISHPAGPKAIVAENERNGFTFWPNSLVKREDTAPPLGGMLWAVEWVP
jgi:hypothetical protein